MVDFRRLRDDDRRSSSRDDDRGSSRGRDDDRGSRRRDDDRGGRDSDRSSRDSDRGRGRDDDRSSGSSRGFRYEGRSREDVQKRSTMGANDFDKILKDGVKMWKPNDGDNRIRVLPPTWPKPKHFGYDIHVNYGVGPDRGSYLSLSKMQNEADPIAEELQRARDDRDPDEKYIKDLQPKRRVLIYLIDRDHPKEGVQAWAMPWTVDRDIVKVSVDKETGEVLPIDDPEHGYDVEFSKTGAKDRTEYNGVAIARRSSALGKDEWLDYAVDNPLPDQLQFYSYDHIAKAFGAKGEQRERSRDDNPSRSRDDDRDSARSRDDGRGGRESGRDDRGRRGDDCDRGREEAALTWETIHDMTATELEDLIEQERLKIDPRESKDDEDLADWICEEMKLEKAPAREERGSRRRGGDPPADESPRTSRVDDDKPPVEDKLARMRERRRD